MIYPTSAIFETCQPWCQQLNNPGFRKHCFWLKFLGSDVWCWTPSDNKKKKAPNRYDPFSTPTMNFSSASMLAAVSNVIFQSYAFSEPPPPFLIIKYDGHHVSVYQWCSNSWQTATPVAYYFALSVILRRSWGGWIYTANVTWISYDTRYIFTTQPKHLAGPHLHHIPV